MHLVFPIQLILHKAILYKAVSNNKNSEIIIVKNGKLNLYQAAATTCFTIPTRVLPLFFSPLLSGHQALAVTISLASFQEYDGGKYSLCCSSVVVDDDITW